MANPKHSRKAIWSKRKAFFWLTLKGKQFLLNNHPDQIPDTIVPPTRDKLKPSDVDDAVRIFKESFSRAPYVKPHEVAWAASMLDEDIKAELAKAGNELENMWVAFERAFGHRWGAKIGPQSEMRDPAVQTTSVRMFRALDEQRRRFNFPPSVKPPA